MLVTFEEQYLEELYTKGKADGKKHRYQPQTVRGYQKAVRFLISAKRIEDLFPIKSLHFEDAFLSKQMTSIELSSQQQIQMMTFLSLSAMF